MNQQRLKELLHYDAPTGVFRWRNVRKDHQGKPWDVAGYAKTNGYFQVRIDGKYYLLHRLAWLYTHGKFPFKQTDHINHVRSDNRLSNLRECTNSENQQNKQAPSHNTSGHKGVVLERKTGKWKSQIKINAKYFYLGTFANKEDAIFARVKAEEKLHPFRTGKKE